MMQRESTDRDISQSGRQPLLQSYTSKHRSGSRLLLCVDQRDSAVNEDEKGKAARSTSGVTEQTEGDEDASEAPAAVDQEGDSDDTDLDIERETKSEKGKPSKFDCTGRQMYLGACKMFGQVPVSYFLKQGHKESLRIRHHSLGVMGVKTLCISLVTNTTLEKLDLDDNGMEDQGCSYIAEMLKENYFITDLTLSNNSIGYKGAISLFCVIKQSDSLVKLNVAGNKMGDRAAQQIHDAICVNTKLRELNLSCNGFGELSGEYFGKMLEQNYSLERLDISYNSLRLKGMQQFLAGVKKNISLLYLNLDSNGIGLSCAPDVGKMLKDNKTLEELIISNNRIPLAGVLPIARAFRFNSTLEYLDLSCNVFMAPGGLVMLESLMKFRSAWGLRMLTFGNLLVTQQFSELQDRLERENHLLIKHGGIMEEWNITGVIREARTSREALIFLTDQECKQLARVLRQEGRVSGNESMRAFHMAFEQLGWSNRSLEAGRRLLPLIERGKIEYTSLEY